MADNDGKPCKVATPGQPRDRQCDLLRLRQYAQRLSDASITTGLHEQAGPEVDSAEKEARPSIDELITQHIRSSKAAHFDIHKHGEPVAEIDLSRSAYRAGDTITGVVKLNQEGWRFQVLKVGHDFGGKSSFAS